MSDHYHMEVRAKRFNPLHRLVFPFAPGCLVAGSLAVFSMAALAGQTARELTTETPEWSLSTQSTPVSARQPDQPCLDASQPQTRPESRDTYVLISTKFNCLVPAQQVHEGWGRQEIVLIDVRRSSEFEKYQIPNSLTLISPAELIASLPEGDWKFIDPDCSLPSRANHLPAASVIKFQADIRWGALASVLAAIAA